jgi:hypothetical protein
VDTFWPNLDKGLAHVGGGGARGSGRLWGDALPWPSSARGPGRRPARGEEEREARRRPAHGAEERKAGRQPAHGGGSGRRGVEEELGATAVFDASPSYGRRWCVARGGGRRMVQRRGRRGGSWPVEEAAAGAGWRRSSGSGRLRLVALPRPSSVRGPGRQPTRGAEEREAERRLTRGVEERKAGRQPARGGGSGRRGVEEELGPAVVFGASPSRRRRRCVAQGGGQRVVQRKVGRQPTRGGGSGRRGVEEELEAAAVFNTSPSHDRH